MICECQGAGCDRSSKTCTFRVTLHVSVPVRVPCADPFLFNQLEGCNQFINHQLGPWTIQAPQANSSNRSQTKGRRQSQASLRSQFWCRSEFVPINLSENFEGMTSHHTTVSKKSNTSKQYFQMRNNSTQSKGLSEKRPRTCTFHRRFLNDL